MSFYLFLPIPHSSMKTVAKFHNVSGIVYLAIVFYNNACAVRALSFGLVRSPECSVTGMGQFPICKLKWDLLRTSVTACTIDKNTFSAPYGILYMRTEI